MTFNNIKYYDSAFLNNINPAQLEQLVENCFNSKSKNYELLAILTARLGTAQICPLQHAIKLLEDKAVVVMIDNYKNKTIEILRESSYAGLPSVWDRIKAPTPYGMSLKTKKQKILIMADKYLALVKEISQKDIENYALIAPLSKVLKLLVDKKVNLSEMNLSLPHLDVETLEPLLKDENYKSLEDILLTHTYSDNKNATEVQSIYHNLLYHNSKMANDALKYLALNILKGDDVKIFFTNKKGEIEGGYMPFLNYIIVNPNTSKFSDAALAAHEIEHYKLCNINPDSACFPFNIAKTQRLISMQDDQYGYFLNQSQSADVKEVKYFKDLNNDNDIFIHYEIAAKSVFVKVAKLLGLSEKSLDPYVLSKDSILYLKDNTLIDLFLGSDKLSFSQQKSYAEAYYKYSNEFFPASSLNSNISFFDNINKICFAKPSFEDIENLRFDNKENFQSQIDFVRDYYFPYYINKMSLNDNQVWFLHRMSEMFNRELDIYDAKPSYYGAEQSRFAQYYIELIVRYPEFIASGMDQDILDSFSSLVQYYNEDLSPLVQEQIDEFFSQAKEGCDNSLLFY